MLPRILEPEVMDTEEEARDYDAMDHRQVNARFCDDLLGAANLPAAARVDVLDVGTGTALIPLELCARIESAVVEAIDLGVEMLKLGRANVARAGLAHRVHLARIDAKSLPYRDDAFAIVMSNSIVHHIPEPAAVFSEMWRVLAPGGTLFVRDLHRPETNEAIDALVALHAGTRPDGGPEAAAFDRQRALLRASLAASLTVQEIAAMVAPLGIPARAVAMTSDRHWTLACTKPVGG